MRRLIILLIVLAIGIGAYFVLRDGGLLDDVTEARVEQALIDNGAPPALAECMAPKLNEKLTISQLLALEELAPQEGEDRVPSSIGGALERIERVDDPEAVRALLGAGTSCAAEALRDRIGEEFGNLP